MTTNSKKKTRPQGMQNSNPKVEKPMQQIIVAPARLIEEQRNASHYLIDQLIKAVTTSGMSVEVIERMWAMQKEAENRQAEREFAIAKVALAHELPPIPKNHKIEFVDKKGNKQETPYADRGDIESVLDPICRKHGFSKEYSTDTDANGRACQVLTVRHITGHKEVYRSPYMVADTTGSKNNNQAAGSTAEYGKRYALIGAFNIIGVDKDDDGNMGRDPSDKAEDKFTARVAAEAHTEERKKLTLPEAAAQLEAVIRAAEPEKRGDLFIKHISIIEAMQKDANLSAKAEELRQMVDGAADAE